MDARSTMLKIAYLKGLEKAAIDSGADPGFLKEAGLGSWLAKGVGKLLYRPARYAAPAKDATATGLRGMLGLAPKGELVRGARGLLPEVGRLGKNLMGFGMKTTAPGTGMSKAFKAMTLGGRQVPATMLQLGGFGGLMGGLMGGQPGEGFSWSGAGKGFLGGAAGGLGWAAGGRLARGALGKALSSKAIVPGGRLAGFAERGKRVWGLGGKQPGFWSQRVGQKMPGQGFKELWKTPSGPAGQSVLRGLGQSAKDIGTKAALGVPIAAGVFGGNLLAEDVASRALGQPGAATTPEAWARRGYYTMTPGGRMAYRG